MYSLMRFMSVFFGFTAPHGSMWQENGEWQKKISILMVSQQKRDEARGEHGGRGLEKEPTPAHESEKQYAEALASIVSCREKLKEMQVWLLCRGGRPWTKQ